MVIDDYHMTMSKKLVRIAQLKARLSEYLRAVRKGGELTVYDRDQPIARVVPYQSQTGGFVVREPVAVYAALGRIALPPPARLAEDAVELLLEDRRRER